MAIGTSLMLLAVGAILRFAVYYSVHGIALGVVGIVLMAVGALGLILSLAFGFTPWSTRHASYSYREDDALPPGPARSTRRETYVEDTRPRV